jgi:hypothetical protein
MRVVHLPDPDFDYDVRSRDRSYGDMYVGCGLLVWTTARHRAREIEHRPYPVIRRQDISTDIRKVTCMACLSGIR